MKLLMILIGIVLMLAGLALAGVGVLWNGPDGAMTGPYSSHPFVRGNIVPSVRPVVDGLVPLIPQGAREFLFFTEHGLLPLFGILGLLVFLSGGLILRNLPEQSSRAVVRKNKDKVKSEVLKREAEKQKAQAEGRPAAAAPAAAGGGKAAALSAEDEKKLLGDTEKEGMFDGMDEEEKTNHMVSLFHAALEKKQCDELLKLFRPRLADFMDIYRDDALSALTKQALELEIIRRRRQAENISPDQFRTFDDKIVQLERETICYRYLPVKPDAAPEEAREYFGLVYDRFNHSAVQQKLKSDADDWRGISLRNAAEILAEKSPPRKEGGAEKSGGDSEKSES